MPKVLSTLCLLVSLVSTQSCKSRSPTSKPADVTAVKVDLSQTICLDAQMLTLSNSAQAYVAKCLEPLARGAGVSCRAIAGNKVEPRVNFLNRCIGQALGQEISLQFAFGSEITPPTCRCIVSGGAVPKGFIPALSCGADQDEANDQNCILVRVKGCDQKNIDINYYSSSGRRLSCVNHASSFLPGAKQKEFRDGNTDDLLTEVLDKKYLNAKKCPSAVITSQQWKVFQEQRPGFAKRAEVFGAAKVVGNTISCADPADVKWVQSKAFKEGGVESPCFATSISGFGSCQPVKSTNAPKVSETNETPAADTDQNEFQNQNPNDFE